MGLRGHLSERHGAEAAMALQDKVMSKAVPHLDTQIDMPNQGAKSR